MPRSGAPISGRCDGCLLESERIENCASVLGQQRDRALTIQRPVSLSHLDASKSSWPGIEVDLSDVAHHAMVTHSCDKIDMRRPSIDEG